MVPTVWSVSSGDSLVALNGGDPLDLTGTDLPIDVAVEFGKGKGQATFDVTIIYCSFDATSLCYIDQVRYEVPLEVGASGPSSQIVLERAISTPGA